MYLYGKQYRLLRLAYTEGGKYYTIKLIVIHSYAVYVVAYTDGANGASTLSRLVVFLNLHST